MGLRKETFAPGEYYHLYNRGTDKRIIFKDKSDYKHFIFLMYVCNSTRKIVSRNIGKSFDRIENLIDIGAYCLMPNHFHLLVRERRDGGISKYMRKLLTGYSMYFNKKYNRTGKLYESKFKSIHTNTDRYLKYLYSYIHLNPAKLMDKDWRKYKNNNKKLLDYIIEYPYSSAYEYKDQRFYVANPSNFPKFFRNFKEHKSELFEWLHFTT